MPPPQATPDFSGEADARLDDEAQMQAVLALIGRLREEEQDVFWLCGWSELSYEEAATALDVPVGTVRSRLSRARARLRELGASSDMKRVKPSNWSRSHDLNATTSRSATFLRADSSNESSTS